jgi:hypothetical protein
MKDGILYIDIAQVARTVNGRKPIALGVVKPNRHGLTLLQGGQSAKQYAPRVPNQSTNQSNTPRSVA